MLRYKEYIKLDSEKGKFGSLSFNAFIKQWTYLPKYDSVRTSNKIS